MFNSKKQEPKTQNDLVKEKLGGRESAVRHEISERVSVPGIESLHLKSADEIAKVLANVIKSRQGVRSMTYIVGSHIEMTSLSDIVV